MLTFVPFSGLDRRSAWLRGILILATGLGLVASLPVWLNARTYPLLPIASGFPILPSPWDGALVALMLFSLVAAGWLHRPAVITFLAASLFAYLGDQNRGQPWFYLYWVMLLLTLLPSATSLAACRWALTTVYLWGGIQKCNARFFEKVPEWFVSPAAGWYLPAFAVDALRWAAASAPFLEIAIAVGLWFPKTRRPALAAVAVLHLFAVLFLGPLGHNYNWVVWPWNLAMIALAFTLFATSRQAKAGSPSLKDSGQALIRSKPALAILLPFALLPILSYFGKWDSYFSFALYSESNATANLFVTQSFVDRLPSHLQPYVTPLPQYDPQFQGPFLFNPGPWAYEELHVPPIAEPRAFRSLFNALKQYAPEADDLRLIVGERGGRVMFYQGDSSWPLQAR